MKNIAGWSLSVCALLLLVLAYEAHENRLSLEALAASGRYIAEAEREDNYMWLHQTTTDQWTGVDGGLHAVTTERRQSQSMRDWLDLQNQIVDAKIASRPLSYAPREVR